MDDAALGAQITKKEKEKKKREGVGEIKRSATGVWGEGCCAAMVK